MENLDLNKKDEKWESPFHNRSGRIWAGAFIVAVGLVWLTNQMGVLAVPHWFFSWEMLLIVIGIFSGLKHSFQNKGWVIMVAVGSIFIIDDIFPGTSLAPYVWPIAIISLGLMMIFKPKKSYEDKFRDKWRRKWEKQYQDATTASASDNDVIDSVAFFGAIKKKILSKDFKGGEAVAFFGGTEINLTQADINGKVTLDLTQIFGGTKLVVPPHWEVHSEIVAVFGGIDDKREVHKDIVTDNTKVLILKGTSVFGGIEIRSY